MARLCRRAYSEPMPARTIFLVAAALAAGGCRSFAAPRAETLARLRPMPIGGELPPRFEFDLASPSLTGTFDAVFVVAEQGLRLQLFPDIGGKVLDLQVQDSAVVADMPGHHYEARPPLDAAAPHLALVLASVFAELLAPVAPHRVLGERAGPEGRVEVLLRPALGSGRVVATVGPDGTVERYEFALGWLHFGFTAAGELVGDGFSGALRLPARR